MTRTPPAALFALALLAAPAAHADGAVVGQKAPAFQLTDTDGLAHSLSDHAGKTVVLEWFNPDCPFVVYTHGEGGPLATQPARVVNENTVWLAINSSAPGNQGHGVELNKAAAAEWQMDHPILIDEDGTVGRLYGARTTPQMFIVDTTGKLVYAGALDNSPLGKSQGEPTNYVSAALGQIGSEGGIKADNTKPYGCSVKY